MAIADGRLHARRHPVDRRAEGERHDQGGDADRDEHQQQRQDDARLQPRLARRPEIGEEAPQRREARLGLAPSSRSHRLSSSSLDRRGARRIPSNGGATTGTGRRQEHWRLEGAGHADPVIYVIAILGCGESDAPAARCRIDRAALSQRGAPAAPRPRPRWPATPTSLSRRSSPSCRPADARAAAAARQRRAAAGAGPLPAASAPRFAARSPDR